MTEHIESDQNHTALPNTQHISPQDFLPIAKLAGKEWASPVIFYQRKARAESTRDVSLNRNQIPRQKHETQRNVGRSRRCTLC